MRVVVLEVVGTASRYETFSCASAMSGVLGLKVKPTVNESPGLIVKGRVNLLLSSEKAVEPNTIGGFLIVTEYEPRYVAVTVREA